MLLIILCMVENNLEYEEETEGVDMCKAMENRYREKEVIGAITGMRMMGASDNDIIVKIVEKFNVTREYVMALLAPKKA